MIDKQKVKLSSEKYYNKPTLPLTLTKDVSHLASHILFNMIRVMGRPNIHRNTSYISKGAREGTMHDVDACAYT